MSHQLIRSLGRYAMGTLLIVRILLLYTMILPQGVLGMIAAPTYLVQDYTKVVQEHPYGEAACLIEDPLHHIFQTGILVAPNLVLTAAHGIHSILKKRDIQDMWAICSTPDLCLLFYRKDGSIQKVMSSAVWIDNRYLEDIQGKETKYDLAWVFLSEPIAGISIPSIAQDITITDKDYVSVLTLGHSDAPFSKPMPRGFFLFELDRYFSHSKDPETLNFVRSILLSSLYFNPATYHPIADINDTEQIVRNRKAVENWLRWGKKPYALGLPGTSGSGAFLHREGQPPALLGVVTAFAPLDGEETDHRTEDKAHMALLSKRQECLGAYQTIMTLLYKEDLNASSHHHGQYTLDPQVDKIMQQSREKSP